MPDWQKGEPRQAGWYDCRIDGEKEDRLQWWICLMNPKKRHWKDRDGKYMDGHTIEWIGEPTASIYG